MTADSGPPRIEAAARSLAVGGFDVRFGKDWIACQYPERPPDRNVMYHVMPNCHGCNVAKEAAARASRKAPSVLSDQPKETK